MEKLKRYLIFLVGLFVNSLGSQSDYQGKPGNLTNLINSLCVKPELSIHTWKLYHLFQYLTDHPAADHSAEEF